MALLAPIQFERQLDQKARRRGLASLFALPLTLLLDDLSAHFIPRIESRGLSSRKFCNEVVQIHEFLVRNLQLF
jgi:hypothetical protein